MRNSDDKVSMDAYRDALMKLREGCVDVNMGIFRRPDCRLVRLDNYRVRLNDERDDLFYGFRYNFDGKEGYSFGDDEWQDFWRVTKEVFPMFSVCLNKDIAHSRKSEILRLKMINDYWRINSDSHLSLFDAGQKVLEIGCGYGGCVNWLDEVGCRYYGIDYCLNDRRLEKDRRFIEIKRSGIPKRLMRMKFDVIFSTNVFQHITIEQKLEYFCQVHDCLKEDGIFFFDTFAWNYEHGKRIRNGFTCKFFMTELRVPTEKEYRRMLSDCGLEVVILDRNRFHVGKGEENKIMGYYCRRKK